MAQENQPYFSTSSGFDLDRRLHTLLDPQASQICSIRALVVPLMSAPCAARVLVHHPSSFCLFVKNWLHVYFPRGS